MNCWNSKLIKSIRQSAAKPQTLLWKVQRLMGIVSVLCNTILASDTLTIKIEGGDIVQAVEKSIDNLQLRAANAPAPYNLVMSDEGIWGDKGLQGLLVDVAVTGSNAKPASLLGEQGQEMMSRGWVTSLGGINIYFSNEINDNVGSGGDSASFMFSRGAMGLAVGPEGLFRIETERNASFRSTEYVATGFWGEVETKDAFGVYILHDVS